MAAYFRLEDLRHVDSATTQEREFAVDVGAYKTLVFQVRVPKQDPGASGSLVIQHAAVNEESAYVDTAAVFDLTTAAQSDNLVVVLSDALRYIRWSVPQIANEASFIVDVIAREN